MNLVVIMYKRNGKDIYDFHFFKSEMQARQYANRVRECGKVTDVLFGNQINQINIW